MFIHNSIQLKNNAVKRSKFTKLHDGKSGVGKVQDQHVEGRNEHAPQLLIFQPSEI